MKIDFTNLQLKLKDNGIPKSVFYPIPLHLQGCFKYLNYKQNDFPVSDENLKKFLSKPIYLFLTKHQIDYIILNIKNNL